MQVIGRDRFGRTYIHSPSLYGVYVQPSPDIFRSSLIETTPCLEDGSGISEQRVADDKLLEMQVKTIALYGSSGRPVPPELEVRHEWNSQLCFNLRAYLD